MHADKIRATQDELAKVQEAIRLHQELEQRLLGRLVTLQELQSEDDARSNPPTVVADIDESPAD